MTYLAIFPTIIIMKKGIAVFIKLRYWDHLNTVEKINAEVNGEERGKWYYHEHAEFNPICWTKTTSSIEGWFSIFF